MADVLSYNPTGSTPVNGVAEEESQIAAVKSAPTTIEGLMLKSTLPCQVHRVSHQFAWVREIYQAWYHCSSLCGQRDQSFFFS